MHKVKVIKVQGLVPYPETGDEKQNLQILIIGKILCPSLGDEGHRHGREKEEGR